MALDKSAIADLLEALVLAVTWTASARVWPWCGRP
jgi:hypothetical protein